MLNVKKTMFNKNGELFRMYLVVMKKIDMFMKGKMPFNKILL